MSTTTRQPATPGAGKALAEHLGIDIIGTEGHDLMGPCIACNSSDAMRIHGDTGVGFCHSCGKGWNAFDLCKVALNGDKSKAVDAMVAAGLFEPRNGQRKRQATKTTTRRTSAATSYVKPEPSSPEREAPTHKPPPISPEYQAFIDSLDAKTIEEWATRKGCTVRAFRAFGAKGSGDSVTFPMFDSDGRRCSTYTLSPDWPKGRNEGGKPVGLFLPGGKRPEPGTQVVVCEGVKDAAALHHLEVAAVGLPGNRLQQKFAAIFEDVDVVIVPDLDRPGFEGACRTADVLADVARSVRVAQLPGEIESTGGQDVRDILQEFGDRGPDAVRKSIEEATPAAAFAKRHGLSVGQEGKPDAEPIRFESLTCAELVNSEFSTRYLVDGMLVAGQPCILAGPKKSLKTNLLLDLSLGLATGGNFLAKFQCEGPTPVGVMTGESGMASIQDSVRRIASAYKYDPATIENLHISDRLPRFGQPESEAGFAEFVTSKGLEVVVIDPAYLAMPGGDAGNLFAVGEQLKVITEICQDANCTLLLAHHTRKNLAEPYGVPELEDISWAGFQEFARQWLLLNRRERYEPGTGSHKLWLSVGGSAGHSSLWGVDVMEGNAPNRFWHTCIMPPDEVRQAGREAKQEARAKVQEDKLDSDRRAIVFALNKFPKGETKSTIKDACGVGPPRFGRALASLIDDGTIVPVEISKGNNRKYEGYKVAEVPEK